MEQEFKSGFISIVGRTNVGKSTLLNSLTGEKVAITANKSQTTRNAIRAIVNRKSSQMVFIDTPGVHKPKTKLGEVMVETAYGAIKDVDLVVFVVDATRKEIPKGDSIILEKIKEAKPKTILVLNKIDLIPKEELLHLIALYQKEYSFEAVVPISALQKENIEVLLDEIEKYLKPGPAYYDIEEYTDQTERQLVEEVIREKALQFLDEEVPHGIYVETENMKERKTKKAEEIYDIEATIYCLRESHKGIIIGKKGAMLKRIASASRYELEKMLGIKINLKVWVKVRENWQEKTSIVNRFKNQ